MAAIWGRLSGASPEPYSVTYSPVAAAYLDASRTRDTDKPFVLLPGRITPAKRQLEFLSEVSPALAVSGIATVIAGDAGPAQSDYEDACRKAAAPLQEFVRFLGYCPDMLPLYSSASVVVIPSRFEGLSRAMIEGMACGCPVVSFDVCSAHEILDEGAGVVVPQLDWVGMADATLDLCGEARNSAVGSLGRAQARRLFDPVDVIDRYEQAFDAARTRR
jgi:glycosyltransferase involved in cell wall biosynthesis